MVFLYEFVILGSPSIAQVTELEKLVSDAVSNYGLQLGQDVSWVVCPKAFNPDQQKSTAAVFFGDKDAPYANLPSLLRQGIPVLPVVSDIKKVKDEIPLILQSLNCIAYNNPEGTQRVVTAFLECAGLLPRQRRVFVSYRREEARQSALQLFNAFSSRLYEVFLDTHGVAPAEDFQAVLWHRLCDSDVLVMLDTENYFTSRWTSAEFGRALAKGISVMRIGWPGVLISERAATATQVNLHQTDIDLATGSLKDEAITRICAALEVLRSKSHAVRNLNIVSKLRSAVESIGGSVIGVGINKSIHIQLADGKKLVLFPTVGVPTAINMYDAALCNSDLPVAIAFDPIGLNPNWLKHLDWLGLHIQSVRWVKVTEAAWQLADWKDNP